MKVTANSTTYTRVAKLPEKWKKRIEMIVGFAMIVSLMAIVVLSIITYLIVTLEPLAI